MTGAFACTRAGFPIGLGLFALWALLQFYRHDPIVSLLLVGLGMSSHTLAPLLNTCREMLIAQISGSLPDILGKLETELLDLSDISMEREARNTFKEASAAIAAKRNNFPYAFKWAMLDEFGAKLSGKPNKAPAANEQTGLSSLSLVDKEDQDEDLTVNKVAKGIKEACGEELSALTRRVGKMMDKPDLDVAANPLGPDAIFNALQSAAAELQTSVKAKMAIYTALEKHLAPEIKDLYEKINGHLVQNGILPQIQFSAATPQSAKSYASRAAAATLVKPPQGVDSSLTASPDLFATLQQLVTQQQSTGNFQTQLQRPGQGYTPLQTQLRTPGHPMQQTPLGSQLSSQSRRPRDPNAQMPGATPMEALNSIQHGDWGALAQQIGLDNDETSAAIASGSVNVLHEIRNTPIADNLGQVDAMTIDIIAMLFDYVLGDRRIPAVVRALLGRLQIPILKVAILDKAFFASKSHPARKLIDTIAAAAIGIDADRSREDRMFKKIESAVEKVLGKFDSDMEIFVEVLADFEQFLETDTAEIDKKAEDSTKFIQEREKLEIGGLMSHKEVLRRTVGAKLPQPVDAFLSGPWATALSITYSDHGDESPQWSGMIATMDDLVWSVMPKANSDDRKKLVSLLPYLLKRLQEGMNIANLQPALRDQFFASLVDCHSVAVKAGLRSANPELSVSTRAILDQGGQVPAEEPAIKHVSFADAPSAFAAKDGDQVKVETQESVDAAGNVSKFVKRHVSRENVDMVEIRLNEEDHSLALGRSDDFNEIVSEMKRGAWVEFKMDDGRNNRARLTWVSPLKGIYLFTNHMGFSGGAGFKPISISPQALAAQLRNGQAEIISDSALVDSAMGNLINNLQQPPETVSSAQKTVANRP
jgi:Protein of unknown function (DUF1631)